MPFWPHRRAYVAFVCVFDDTWISPYASSQRQFYHYFSMPFLKCKYAAAAADELLAQIDTSANQFNFTHSLSMLYFTLFWLIGN